MHKMPIVISNKKQKIETEIMKAEDKLKELKEQMKYVNTLEAEVDKFKQFCVDSFPGLLYIWV